jgi:hypothetical protein
VYVILAINKILVVSVKKLTLVPLIHVIYTLFVYVLGLVNINVYAMMVMKAKAQRAMKWTDVWLVHVIQTPIVLKQDLAPFVVLVEKVMHRSMILVF